MAVVAFRQNLYDRNWQELVLVTAFPVASYETKCIHKTRNIDVAMFLYRLTVKHFQPINYTCAL